MAYLSIPKTWKDLEKVNPNSRLCSIYHAIGYVSDYNFTPQEKSALALLIIRELIEVGYGGNPSIKEKLPTNSYYEIDIDLHGNFTVDYDALPTSLIVFHNIEQAEEFLSYPENIQLLKDYFMIYGE